MTDLSQRQFGKPSIKWHHIDGPLLVCSDGTPHFLTFFDRLWLWCGLITVNDLDNKHMGAELRDLLQTAAGVREDLGLCKPRGVEPDQPWPDPPSQESSFKWEGSEGQGHG